MNRALIFDIEGTTTSLAFVKETLFPYAEAHLDAFLDTHGERPDVAAVLREVRRFGAAQQRVETPPAAEAPTPGGATPSTQPLDTAPSPDPAEPPSDSAASAAEAPRGAPSDAAAPRDAGAADEGEGEAASLDPRALLKAWMAADVKVTPLKTLQGLIWEAGYASGELRGHLYDEVAPVVRSLCERGYRLAIFSSGSVAAQRLLFGHSVAGDLTPYIEAYFDTRTGAKGEAVSYKAIARALGLPPASCAFFSDIASELRGADAAGMRSAQLVRPGTTPAPGQTHLSDFQALNAWVSAHFA